VKEIATLFKEPLVVILFSECMGSCTCPPYRKCTLGLWSRWNHCKLSSILILL